MEFNNNLGEYKESINRLQATPREVTKVGKDIEYSNRLVKAHNVMKVLDLPDEQDNPVRQILLKQDDNTLEELASKPKNEIQTFLLNEKNKKTDTINHNTDQNNQYIEQKLSKIKQAFPQSILDKNPDIADKFKLVDQSKDPVEKDKILQEILQTLKNPGKLKSITDQLGGADKNNPQYLEFKNALLGVDSGFESYFKDLESIHSGASLSTDKIVAGIEKDSGGMMDIDLKSNPPLSKMSLIGSAYSFDEEIDQKALEKITTESKEKLDEAQSSYATLKGLYKPFDDILIEARSSWGKENFKEKMQTKVSGFTRGIFSEADEMYEKMGIKSDIQIKESDIASLANADSESYLRQKIENIKDKFQKIKTHIQEVQAGILDKHESGVKELLSKKSEAKEKQLEVLNFMKACGFDLIPKEISDNIIREIQADALHIPGLDMNRKNIDLKNGNFGEDYMKKGVGLNNGSKTNMVKFMNKLIGGSTNEPLSVESIANGSLTADPSFLQAKFLESGVVDALGWKQGKMLANLEKASTGDKIA